MRKILKLACIAALLTPFAGCDEAEMIKYGAGGELNVYGWYDPRYVGTGTGDNDGEAYLKYKGNFGLMPADRLADTLYVGVKVMGDPVNYDRKVRFRLIPDERVATALEVTEVPGLSYVLPAGAAKVVLKYLVGRIPACGSFTGRWAIDFERSDFSPGAEGKDAFTLDVKNILTLEILGVDGETWSMYEQMFGVLFGFSDTKARFLINNGITDIAAWLNGDQFDVMLGCYDLQAALDEYKSNPDNPPLYDETKFPDLEWIYFVEEMDW